MIGDGEEVIGELADVVGAWKRGGRASRDAVLRDLATIPGVYVPAMYDCEYDGPELRAITPRHPDVPAVIDKRTVADLAEWPYPKHQLVPLVEVVHDRLNVEIFRGCTRGCRFCQAGMITRPVRERPEEQVRTMVREGLRRTGYDEVALTSLSSADFSGIDGVVAGLVNDQEGTGAVSVSLPSLRVDAFSVGIASEIQKVRRTGLTFAPEAGSWRSAPGHQQVDRRRRSVHRGRRRVLPGLAPDEALLPHRPADRDGRRHVGHRESRGQRRRDRPAVHEAGELHRVGGRVRAQAAHAVPVVRPERRRRAVAQDRAAALGDEGNARRSSSGTILPRHSPKGLASRGDRRIGRVIERVWRAGGTFQEWSEHFALDRWLEAMHAEGLDPDWYVTRHRTRDELLPWSHIAAGLHADFLWDDWQAALAAHGLPDCRWTPCYDCGVCTDYALEHVVASPTPPAGGSQGTGQDLTRGGEAQVAFLSRRGAATGATEERRELAGVPSGREPGIPASSEGDKA